MRNRIGPTLTLNMMKPLDILVHIGCKGGRWEAEVAPKAGFWGF